MKRKLTGFVLALMLIMTMVVPAALASQTAMAVRRSDREAVRICNQTFRDAKRAALGLPHRLRRARMQEARREHRDCLRRARR